MADLPLSGGDDINVKPTATPSDSCNDLSRSDLNNSKQSAVHFLRALQVSAEQRERFLQLEFKAKKAYECAVNLLPPPSGMSEKLVEQISKVLNELQMEELARRLNQDPPMADLVPQLFELAHRSLLDALPPRLHECVMEDLRNSMSWNENSAAGVAAISRITVHMSAIVGKIAHYGAPRREPTLKEALSLHCRDINECKPSLGVAVAEGFRFLFSSIKQLHEDVSEYTLLLLSEDLKKNAVEYIRTFLSTCLPPVQTWQSSIDFLKRYIHSPEVEKWVATQVPSSLFFSPVQLHIRGALLFGILDLLRSGGRNSGNRWSGLPLEIFYFDKALIFSAANAIQEGTLLILLEGAISSIFKGKGGSSMDTTAMLHRLHSKIMSLFSQDIRLDDLKREAIYFIHNLLSSEKDEMSGKTVCEEKRAVNEVLPPKESKENEGGGDTGNHRRLSTPFPSSRSSLSPTSLLLSAEEEQMILSVIDKMANTEDALYMSFEQKVLSYLSTRLLNREQTLPPLGLITSSLVDTAGLLSRGLDFHWEVFAPFYDDLMPALELP